jgi:hypothetical protein
MMLRGVVTILLVFAGYISFGQNSDLTLNDFKTGVFKYQTGKYKGGIITRTKKWQVEEYPDLNMKIKFRIDWIGNFEYHLTAVVVSEEASEGIIGKVIKVKVLGVKDGVYEILVQNGRKFEKVKVSLLEANPRKQPNFFWVMNSMKVKGKLGRVEEGLEFSRK